LIKNEKCNKKKKKGGLKKISPKIKIQAVRKIRNVNLSSKRSLKGIHYKKSQIFRTKCLS